MRPTIHLISIALMLVGMMIQYRNKATGAQAITNYRRGGAVFGIGMAGLIGVLLF